MAIGLVIDIPEGDQEFYDNVCRTTNWPDDWPEGQIAHYAGPTEVGWRVVDVWETKEQFDRFAQERLGPAIKQVAGDDAPPLEPQIFEIYNEATAKARV